MEAYSFLHHTHSRYQGLDIVTPLFLSIIIYNHHARPYSPCACPGGFASVCVSHPPGRQHEWIAGEEKRTLWGLYQEAFEKAVV
jgi:hypothetical protein